MDVIAELNIRTALRYVFDAGDAASYAGGGAQFITDVSGAGSTIRSGLTAGVDGQDISWAGVAGGNSPNEYFFGAAGGIHFPFSANPWTDTLHLDGAKWAIAGWWYYVPNSVTGGSYLAGTANNYSEVGMSFGAGNNSTAFPNRMALFFPNGSGSSPGAATVWSSGAIPQNQWSFFAIMVDEAAGTYTMLINDTETTGALTFSSPSAGGATNNLIYSMNGEATGKIADSAMWLGTLPTKQQLLNLYNATRPKFGV